MFEDDFPIRLAKLRTQKGISARDMSLSLGQNAGYINNIETGKAMPSMSNFFYICEYLNISPHDFFDMNSQYPEELQTLIDNLKKLDFQLLQNISAIVAELVEK